MKSIELACISQLAQSFVFSQFCHHPLLSWAQCETQSYTPCLCEFDVLFFAHVFHMTENVAGSLFFQHQKISHSQLRCVYSQQIKMPVLLLAAGYPCRAWRDKNNVFSVLRTRNIRVSCPGTSIISRVLKARVTKRKAELCAVHAMSDYVFNKKNCKRNARYSWIILCRNTFQGYFVLFFVPSSMLSVFVCVVPFRNVMIRAALVLLEIFIRSKLSKEAVQVMERLKSVNFGTSMSESGDYWKGQKTAPCVFRKFLDRNELAP